MRYLTKEELIEINKQVYAGEGTKGIQYPEGLDIVIEQPQMVVFDEEIYKTIWIKAAFILQKITKKHIFSDGNKRTAYIATKVFLFKNNFHLEITKDEGIGLMVGVTTSQDTEEMMLKVARFLKEHSHKIK